MSTKNKRWIYAAVGVMVLLLAGMVYAWSVLSSPIGAYFPEWSKAQLSLTYTICMGFFCVGGFLGGLANKKINVKLHVLASGVVFFWAFLSHPGLRVRLCFIWVMECFAVLPLVWCTMRL